jgi:hypothetical protein
LEAAIIAELWVAAFVPKLHSVAVIAALGAVSPSFSDSDVDAPLGAAFLK